jgi:hypothetical protein
MVLSTTAGVGRVLGAVRLVVLVAVVAALGHDAVFAARYGVGADLASALRGSGHEGWWGPLVLAVLGFGAFVLAAQLARLATLSTRARARRRARPCATGPSYLGQWLRLWAVLLPSAAAIFVVQEDLEHAAIGAVGHGLGALTGPEHPLAIPVLALVTGVVAALAALLRWRIRVLERIVVSGRWSTPRRRAILAAPRPSVPATLPRPLVGSLGLAFDPGRAPPHAS